MKGRAPQTRYARAQFGHTWADADPNGCDTRNDILRRDLRRLTVKAGTGGCVILSGDLADPYTRAAVHFVRGGASEVDIDHVVALSNAWQTGARGWTAARRQSLANDPLNLLAVSSSVNRSKGDADTATWLPPSTGYRCSYVARQVAVKAKYGLWVTTAERAAMLRVLQSCPTLAGPTGGLSLAGSASATTPVPASASTPARRTVPRTIRAGAFCAQHGWYGRTATGTLMRCVTSPTDTRYRWRRA